MKFPPTSTTMKCIIGNMHLLGTGIPLSNIQTDDKQARRL